MTIRDLKDIPVGAVNITIDNQPMWTEEEAEYHCKRIVNEQNARIRGDEFHWEGDKFVIHEKNKSWFDKLFE